MNVLVWGLVGYIAGALPSAVIVAHLTGHAHALARAERGAGEVDAHILLREAGAGGQAAIAGTMDVVKAFIPTLVVALVSGPYEAAACAIGTVAGHCWPPVYRRFAGRGLAAGAGSMLAILPFEMVAAGIVTGVGTLVGASGAASTVGYASIPLIATWRGQPAPYRFAAWMVLALIVARRLEGVSADLRRDVHPVRAVVSRVVFDASTLDTEDDADGPR